MKFILSLIFIGGFFLSYADGGDSSKTSVNYGFNYIAIKSPESRKIEGIDYSYYQGLSNFFPSVIIQNKNGNLHLFEVDGLTFFKRNNPDDYYHTSRISSVTRIFKCGVAYTYGILLLEGIKFPVKPIVGYRFCFDYSAHNQNQLLYGYDYFTSIYSLESQFDFRFKFQLRERISFYLSFPLTVWNFGVRYMDNNFPIANYSPSINLFSQNYRFSESLKRGFDIRLTFSIR